ncbi:hydantoinase B/oxoprolinase family protein [Candidatus Aminicenantes bacterium AC-708-M15]|jgi:N-methylhydantoinase B/oxoprolinase/acetone carboxylase alpha subunit|nr:hydantoinase B/oxoprolinase family protein [SCandidatus Aminicenantes bacterium Aminicenantia_JdfR_composite]MCP2597396.1 hydantoinase B/oxoprolinase family protein [Candidatus Aminicenantes bacterium AC-335-G13]MCP2598157.1 hydantoinase B/oxoprolinase family protein [Candidatus Aminicenantes bacterium AC-335-L06]MCP2598909.1 hydantoinase B/oxoprolinase family protein [Candidatus Aminicenantes bacterium AC-335-B20]MCP2603853.1 hydantoinase B/oxoprolinase family protein [Candidatus Aminicenan
MKFDPIELEVFKNIFISIAEEMGTVLGRTAFSPNIKERKDFSCALFDETGETFAQGEHIPVHLGAMSLSVQSALRKIEIEPEDTIILNNPYEGGTHLPDITCISPLFINNKPLFYVANRAHHSDVGGMTPGSMPLATSIFQEGIIIPPLKIVSKGKMNEEVLRLILSNVRTPEEREGDLRAQLAANEVGKERLKEIIKKYGLEKILKYTEYLKYYTERILRNVISTIPDGEYTFHDYLDDDGVSDQPIKIAVKLKVKGEEILIDFSGSSPQVEGSVNANFAVTFSAVLYVFRALIEEDIPFNSGLMKPLKVIAPEGTVVNANFPSAVAGGNVETSQRIVDVLLGALSKAIPDRIPAASQGTMNNIAFGGYSPDKKMSFAYYETIGGGMGASKELPGRSGVHTHMTNSLNTPVEALEAYLPIKINKYCLRKGSGGKGKKQGGDGIIREYEFLTPIEVTIISERRKFSPYGLLGGEAGKRGRNILISKNKKIYLNSKVNLKVNPRDRLIIETPGGGGYGSKE